MAPIARFNLVAFDCRDPRSSAAFYSAITGWPIQRDDGDWVELRSDTGATLAFQLSADHEPPVWPSADRPQQLHLDFDVDDLDEAEAAVLALGARRAAQPTDEYDAWFRVFLDPAGHPFCLVRHGDPSGA